jgi:hypothetical protein
VSIDADPSLIPRLLHDCVAAESPTGDRIVLHVPSGTYLRLDANATVVFDLLSEHGEVPAAADALASRYGIPVERARDDVNSVVTALGNRRASRASAARRPTLAGVADVGRQWWALPGDFRLPVVKVAAAVASVEMGLRVLDLGRLADLLSVPLADGLTEPPVEGADLAGLTPAEQRTYWATGWVLHRWPFPDTCLRRALVNGYFLRRRHPVLRLGLIGDGETTHAWIEAEGMTFNPGTVTATFAGTAPGLALGE